MPAPRGFDGFARSESGQPNGWPRSAAEGLGAWMHPTIPGRRPTISSSSRYAKEPERGVLRIRRSDTPCVSQRWRRETAWPGRPALQCAERTSRRYRRSFTLSMDDSQELIPMPKLTFSARTTTRLLALGLMTAALPLHAQSSGLPFSCMVDQDAADGRWLASTTVDASKGIAVPSSETYEWTPNEKTSFGTGQTLTWGMSYRWPKDALAQKVVPETDVVVTLTFRFDAKKIGQPLKKPPRAALHLYRSSDPEERFSSSSISLTGPVDVNMLANGNVSARVLLPLDSLLAYGTGLDTLVWNMRSAEPNVYRATQVFFKGTLPVAAMRDKVTTIPKLRRLLARKAANFRSECAVPTMMDVAQ